MNFLGKIFTGPFVVTLVRYGLAAAGAWLVANYGFDASQWEVIAGALLTIVVALMGGAEAVKDKAVIDGKSVPVSKLPVAAQNEIEAATRIPAKRRSIFDIFVGK